MNPWLFLGMLNEAVVRFASVESLDGYWGEVCSGCRWILPSLSVTALVQREDGHHVVGGRSERGQPVKVPRDSIPPANDALGRLLRAKRVVWLDDPCAGLEGRDPMRDLLRAEAPALLLGVPFPETHGTQATLLFALKEVEKKERALLANGAVIYSVQASVAYGLLHAQSALRVSEERYALAARGSRDGLWDWAVPTDELFLSARARELLEVGEGATTMKYLNGQVYEVDRHGVFEAFNLHVFPGTPELSVEFRVLTASGHLRWLRMRGLGVRDERGQATRIAGSLTDITDERSRLRQMQVRLDVVIDNAPIALMVISGNREVSLARGRALLSLVPEGGDPTGLCTTLTRSSPAFEGALERAFAGEPSTVEFAWRDRYFQGHFEAMEEAGGEDGSILLVAYDISDRRRAEQDLIRLNTALEAARDQALSASRAKTGFLANMSHELRTPLNAIIGYSEMIEEDGESESIREDASRVLAAARHLLELINEVLDLSRVESGRVSVVLEEFAVADALDELIATAKPLVARNSNRFVTQFADGLGALNTDRTKVKQILLNLLSNAAKFTKDGVVTLRAAPGDDDAGVGFEVADTGIGIPPEDIGSIFDAFTRVEDTRTKAIEGTGLGLAITRRYVEMLGGTVTVESVVGEGTTFRVWLPRALN